MSLRTISEPTHVFGNASTATIPVVAAIPGRTVALHKLIVTASVPTNVTIQDTGGAALSQTFPHAAIKAVILDELDNLDPWFVTAIGLGIQLAQSGSAVIGFDAYYLGGPFAPLPPGTAAPINRPTWNPADKSAQITLSNSNLTAVSASAGAYGVRSTALPATGQWYWEYTAAAWGNANSGVGIATAAASFGSGIASNAATAGVVQTNGGIYVGGTYQGAGLTAGSAGAVVGIAVDLTANLIWFRYCPSGNWNSNATASPGGTGGFNIAALARPLYPFLQVDLTGDGGTLNFGNSAFSGSVPSGFGLLTA